jgi:hypothetical protein
MIVRQLGKMIGKKRVNIFYGEFGGEGSGPNAGGGLFQSAAGAGPVTKPRSLDPLCGYLLITASNDCYCFKGVWCRAAFITSWIAFTTASGSSRWMECPES